MPTGQPQIGLSTRCRVSLEGLCLSERLNTGTSYVLQHGIPALQLVASDNGDLNWGP